MKLKIWCKTILFVYKFLQPLCNTIDRMVLKASSHNDNNSINIYKKVDEILSLTQSKVDLINTKLVVDKILNALPQEYSKILILKFVDNLTSNDIANLLSINVRTYFRKINLALNSFEKALQNYVRQNNVFIEKLIKQTWIKSIFDELEKTQDCENINNIIKFENKYINDCGKIFLTDIKKENTC